MDRVRFAPSPTGELHLGNARTALYNAAVARRGGAFVLRYDDTDTERSREAYARLIAEDLAWLSIVPDEVARQSERLAAYDGAARALADAGLLYPCYESAEELERKRSLQRARGRPPIYDRAALALSAEDRARLEAQGRRPHYRFKLPGGERRFVDRCRGEQTVDLSSLSDPVLVRADGSYLYTLPSVVDDRDMAISLVVRGEDHITNTGVQIALFEALGAQVPHFAHHNLLTRSDGVPLSKRDNPLSLRALREAGYEAMAVASLATMVGTSDPVVPVADPKTLFSTLDLTRVTKGPAMFEVAELDRLNAALLHEMPFAQAKARLAEFGADDPAFWSVVRGNLARFDDARQWFRVVREGPPQARVGEALTPAAIPVICAARENLPAEPWDEATFRGWTGAVREATGAKGKALFLPLRVALTGETSGPELGPFLLLLPREGVAARLDRALDALTAQARTAGVGSA